jgi:hypothetical protein
LDVIEEQMSRENSKFQTVGVMQKIGEQKKKKQELVKNYTLDVEPKGEDKKEDSFESFYTDNEFDDCEIKQGESSGSQQQGEGEAERKSKKPTFTDYFNYYRMKRM